MKHERNFEPEDWVDRIGECVVNQIVDMCFDIDLDRIVDEVLEEVETQGGRG